MIHSVFLPRIVLLDRSQCPTDGDGQDALPLKEINKTSGYQESGQKAGKHPVHEKPVAARNVKQSAVSVQPQMNHMTAMAALSCLPHNVVFDGMANTANFYS